MMDYYQIEFKPAALKQLKKLPKDMIPKIAEKINALATNPRPDGIKKLIRSEAHYRLRVGDYRVIYSVIDDRLIIEVIRIGHRKDVYR